MSASKLLMSQYELVLLERAEKAEVEVARLQEERDNTIEAMVMRGERATDEQGRARPLLVMVGSVMHRLLGKAAALRDMNEVLARAQREREEALDKGGRLRAEVERLRTALRSVAERQREACRQRAGDRVASYDDCSNEQVVAGSVADAVAETSLVTEEEP